MHIGLCLHLKPKHEYGATLPWTGEKPDFSRQVREKNVSKDSLWICNSQFLGNNNPLLPYAETADFSWMMSWRYLRFKDILSVLVHMGLGGIRHAFKL